MEDQRCIDELVLLLRLILNLNLYSTLGGVSGDVESVDGLLEGKSVGDEGFEVYEATSNESKGFGILRLALDI